MRRWGRLTTELLAVSSAIRTDLCLTIPLIYMAFTLTKLSAMSTSFYSWNEMVGLSISFLPSTVCLTPFIPSTCYYLPLSSNALLWVRTDFNVHGHCYNVRFSLMRRPRPLNFRLALNGMDFDDTTALWNPRPDAAVTLGEDTSNLYSSSFRPVVIQCPSWLWNYSVL